MTTTPDARWVAIRAGLSRSWTETRHTSIIEFWLVPVVYVGVLLFIRANERTVPGTDFALEAMILPGLLGMLIAISGFTEPARAIATDAEDGTLLRAKVTPNGMLGYLVGKIAMLTLKVFAGLIVVLVIPGIIIAGELVFDARTWLLLTLIFLAGMVSTVPIGLAIGSLMKSSTQGLLPTVASTLAIFVSGIFYPITALPTWLQWVGQATPLYWVGLGARSALLPAEMAMAEIGGSWRTVETFTVLGVWATIGLLLAPILLRRMARYQSGSTVAAARERIMSKGY